MKQVSFVFLYIYQMEPYNKIAAIRHSKRKYFPCFWKEDYIWGIPHGPVWITDTRWIRMRTPCMLTLPHTTPQHFNYRVPRLFPLFSENGLQTSCIIFNRWSPWNQSLLCGGGEQPFWNEQFWKSHQIWLWVCLEWLICADDNTAQSWLAELRAASTIPKGWRGSLWKEFLGHLKSFTP